MASNSKNAPNRKSISTGTSVQKVLQDRFIKFCKAKLSNPIFSYVKSYKVNTIMIQISTQLLLKENCNAKTS